MKKKLVAIACSFAILFEIIGYLPQGISLNNTWLIASAEVDSETVTFDGGTGSQDDPYLISSAKQFVLLNNNSDYHYKIIKNIYLDNTKRIKEFRGFLDGDFHTIYISRSEKIGLINENYGTVKNCRIYLSSIDTINQNNYMFGSIALNNKPGALIENCITYDDEMYIHNFHDIGGIVAYNFGTISKCENKISFYTSDSGYTALYDQIYSYAVGGIAAWNYGEIKDCINRGSIDVDPMISIGYGRFGGIAGYSSNNIFNCVTTGNIMAVHERNARSQECSTVGFFKDEISALYIYDGPFAIMHSNPVDNDTNYVFEDSTISLYYSPYPIGTRKNTYYPSDLGYKTMTMEEIEEWWEKTRIKMLSEYDDSGLSEEEIESTRLKIDDLYCIVGQTTYINGTYIAKIPSQIENELGTVNISSKGTASLDVELPKELISSDNRTATISIEVNPKTCGESTVTVEYPKSGLEPQTANVYVEPELVLPNSSKGDFYNNYSDVTVLFPKTRKDQTKEVKLTVTMETADKDYLEKFLKSIEIEREENGDLILGRSNYKTSYTISDDGKFAEYTISITSPDIEIKDYLVIKTKAQSKKIRVLRDSTTQDSQLDYTAADYYIIGEVEKYCSDTGNMAIVDEIINSQYSSDAKQEMLLNYFVNKGFNTTLEGSKYISECTTYSRNYNYLINNYNYCSYIYSEDIEKNPSKKLALINGKLIFGNELLEPFNYSPELINHNPTAKKYKEMLRSFICASSTENEVMKNTATLGEVLNNILEIYKESDEAHYNKILTEAQNNMDKLLKGSISENDVYNNMASNISKDVNNGDAKLKIPAISKALGYASTTVSFASATSNDVLALMNLEKDVRLYQDNMYFLQTIVDSPYASYDMQLAAESLLDDIENGYTKLVNDILVNLFKYTKDSVEIMIDFNQWEYFLGSEVSNALLTYKIAVVISNSIVDTGDFIKQTCFTKGYAELADLFQKKLQDDKAEFKINESKDNAWTFFKDYTILWCLRYEGEKQYLEAGKLKYFIAFEGRVANFSDRQSAVEANLSTLEKAKFYIESNIEMPNIQYMKKAVIHCPVDVYVYNPDGTLIVKLKDGIESDITNEYGRFGVVYNPYTDEYDKVIALLNDAGINIKIVSIDDGLVNFNMIKADANDDLHNLSFDNLVIYKNDIVSLNINNNEYLVDRNGDNKIDETAQLIVNDDYIKVDEISFKAGKVSLNVGESSVVNVNVSPLNASYKALNWTSNDKSIAKVENGKITAISAGTTKIHVFALDNPNARIEITVNVLLNNNAITYLGDVNNDGKINVTDVSKTAAHVKGIRPLDEKEQKRADVNVDNKINVTDVSKIAAHVKGIRALQKNNDNQNDTSNSDPKDNSETENGKNDPNEINNGKYAEILYDKECGRWYVEDDDGNALPLTCTYDPDKEIWYTSNGKELNVVHSDNVKNPNYELPDKVAYLVLPNGEAMQLSNSGYLNTIYNEIDGHKVSAIGYRFNTPWVYCGNYGLIDPNNNDSGIKMTIPDNITYCGSASMLTWGLNELQLSDSLLCVEDSAFMVYDGTSLNDTTFNDLKLNNGLKYIGDKAFFGYSALTSVNIPSSVNHIGDYALGYYTDIEKLQEYYQEHIGDEDYELKSPEKFYKKIEDFTIYGKKGTEAERYAKANGFVFIDDNEVLPTSISIDYNSEDSIKISAGKTITLNTIITPSNAYNAAIVWSSTNDAVASVNDGIISANSPGNATIVAKTSNGLTANFDIHVLDNHFKFTGSQNRTVIVNKEFVIGEFELSDDLKSFTSVSKDDILSYWISEEWTSLAGYWGWTYTGKASKPGTVIFTESLENGDSVSITITVLDKGDINGDGYVNDDDLQLLRDYNSNLITLTYNQKERADLNGDGDVNEVDAAQLQDKIGKIDPWEGYVKIYTADDLNNIRNNLNANYVLMNDIDLSGYSNWEPIGAVNNGFTGVFDGNQHSVNNMEITGEYTSTRNFTKGLFSYSDGATFKNLTLAGDIDIVYYGKSGQGPSVGIKCHFFSIFFQLFQSLLIY